MNAHAEKPTWRDLTTEGKIEVLRLAADGAALTALQLSERSRPYLSGPAPSRNSVIGIVTRHNPTGVRLSGTSETNRKIGDAKAKARPANLQRKTPRRKTEGNVVTTPQAFKPGRLPPARPIPAPSLNLKLADLDARQCRYATNDAAIGEEHLFCGQPIEDGSSYCACHRAMCFNYADTNTRRSAA